MIALNKWGHLVLENLRNSRPEMLKELRESGQLDQYLEDRQMTAEEQHERIRQALLKKRPIPKNADYLESVRCLTWATETAEELVLNDLLLPDRETEKAMQQGGYVDDIPMSSSSRLRGVPVFADGAIARFVSTPDGGCSVETWGPEGWEPGGTMASTVLKAPIASPATLKEFGVPVEDWLLPPTNSES